MGRYLKYTAFPWLVVIVSFVVCGATFAILWSWFVAEKFGLPALTVPEAIGLAITLQVLRGSTPRFGRGASINNHESLPLDQEVNFENSKKMLFSVFGYSMLNLFVGAIVYYFV